MERGTKREDGGGEGLRKGVEAEMSIQLGWGGGGTGGDKDRNI